MSANTFGHCFEVTSFGESHSRGVGAVICGCPAGLKISEEEIQHQLDRRRPGQSKITTPRKENDQVRILSGVEFGQTLGTPIALLVENQNQKPGDYQAFSHIPRPSHADFTYLEKFGNLASSGGGRASARETIGRVAAGAIAAKFLKEVAGIEIVAWVSQIHHLSLPIEQVNMQTISSHEVDQTPVRCPNPYLAAEMENFIIETLKKKDSVGGIVTCVCRHIPTGLGEPVFDKCEALLAQAMMSIPAVKGFEIGSGFDAINYTGSSHNDLFVMKNGKLGTLTNRSGGIQGGITNGENIFFRVAFKPTATIAQAQKTVDYQGNLCEIEGHGRHDPCVVPRAVPIVESMAALVLADLLLRQRAWHN